jgi:dihydropteroate synthase
LEASRSLSGSEFVFNLRGRLWLLNRPVVMGILNATPDSFFAGSRVVAVDEALRQAEQMLADGAAILDVGGYSTRPGAAEVSEADETARVVPVVRAIAHRFPGAIVSVDTFRASVAEAALQAGAHMVNDVSGGTDARMLETVARWQVPYVLMHSRGTPQTMTQLTQYTDLLGEITVFFLEKLQQIRLAGIKDVVLDVGFGFAKTIDQNYHLLNNLADFRIIGLPLLVGISRKSMIYKRLGITADEALNGTTVLNTLALTKGASILRVHDVKAAAEAVKLYELTANA